MPSLAARIPTARPALSIRKRFATARPAASSAAVLIRKPELKRASVVSRPHCVFVNWACAFNDARLVTTEKPIDLLLRDFYCLTPSWSAILEENRPGDRPNYWTPLGYVSSPLRGNFRKKKKRKIVFGQRDAYS